MATEALQIDALWSGINNPSNGKSYSGAIVGTFETGTSTPKAVWTNKEKTTPSALGQSQFTLDSNGQAFVFGDGIYEINIYAPTDTGLTSPLITIEGAEYTTTEETVDTSFAVDHKTDFTHIVYNSVSELRAATLTPFDGQKISLLGSVSAGDGGGGDWHWDASSTATDNAGTIVKDTSITTGRWLRLYSGTVNALWFGAPGDSIIQDAIDTGEQEVVIINTGVVYIADNLTIPSTLKVLRGVGLPVLSPSAADNHVIEQDGGSDSLITGIRFQGISATETTDNQLLRILNFVRLTIEGNTFTNGYHRALNLIGCDYFTVSNNIFRDCSNGPYFTGCNYGTIHKNQVIESQQADSVFKIGISLTTFDATYGTCSNIVISDNIVEGLENAQGIMGHGGTAITIIGNRTFECAQGINFNSFSSSDTILDVSIIGNNLTGISSGVSYTPAADVGIALGGTDATSGNVVVTGNNIRRFNAKGLNDNLGGISLIEMDDVLIGTNMIRNCFENGIVFSGVDSTNIQVVGNSIIDITGGASNGGIKIDSPTIVNGTFGNNYIVGCERAYRLETASLPDLIIEAKTEFQNDEVSTGIASCTYNGTLYAIDGDTTPAINPAVDTLVLTSTSATTITDLENSYIGQTVVMFDIVGNTTIADDSTGGNFKLLANADWVFGGTTSVLSVTDRGTRWLQESGSANP